MLGKIISSIVHMQAMNTLQIDKLIDMLCALYIYQIIGTIMAGACSYVTIYGIVYAVIRKGEEYRGNTDSSRGNTQLRRN